MHPICDDTEVKFVTISKIRVFLPWRKYATELLPS